MEENILQICQTGIHTKIDEPKVLYQYLGIGPSELDEYFGRNHANFPIPPPVVAFSPDQENRMNDPQDSTYQPTISQYHFKKKLKKKCTWSHMLLQEGEKNITTEL